MICFLPGSSDRTIIVGAHFDHFPKGDGVVDNWSGAALLPSLYQGLTTTPHTHSYIFIGFTDTERSRSEGGARFYARQMTKEQAAATHAMVNIDTIGMAHPVVWGRQDRPLAAILFALAKQLNVQVTDDVTSRFIFDSAPFSERNIPSITVNSLTLDVMDAQIAQTPKDKISALHFDDYYQTYKLLAAYLVLLDQLSPARKH